jgi:hypothetical protein
VQAQISALTGYSCSQVSNWDHGMLPYRRERERIATALGATVEELFDIGREKMRRGRLMPQLITHCQRCYGAFKHHGDQRISARIMCQGSDNVAEVHITCAEKIVRVARKLGKSGLVRFSDGRPSLVFDAHAVWPIAPE